MIIIQTEWPELITKVGFPTAILIILGLIGRYALWPYLKKQNQDNLEALKAARTESTEALKVTIQDARQERDYMRQIREKEAGQFLESLKSRDQIMERGFREMVDAIRELKETRKR